MSIDPEKFDHLARAKAQAEAGMTAARKTAESAAQAEKQAIADWRAADRAFFDYIVECASATNFVATSPMYDLGRFVQRQTSGGAESGGQAQ